MIIFIDSDENGYVDGWGSTRSSENDIELKIDEDHEFFKTDIHVWKYEDGDLVFDEDKKKKLVKEREQEESKPLKSEVNEMALLELAGMIAELKGGN